jgi:hypothetical protein
MMRTVATVWTVSSGITQLCTLFGGSNPKPYDRVQPKVNGAVVDAVVLLVSNDEVQVRIDARRYSGEP